MERNGKIRFAYERGQTTFVNPYHFVRLDPARDSRMKDSEEQKEQSLSGVLHCSFETMTPLAVPDTEKAVPDTGKKDECLIGGDSGKIHYRYPFYSINKNKRPIVPGSSVRGMLRSVYESLTDSCFVTIPDEEQITARTGSSDAFDPAILRREAGNKWVLHEATRYRVPIKEKDRKGKFRADKDEKGRYIQYNHEKFRSGEKVDIEPGTAGGKKIVTSMKHTKNGNCYVYVGENGPRKRYESVFEMGNSLKVPEDEIKELMNRLENTLKMYQNESINRCLKGERHTGYAHYAEEKKRGVICVWHKETNGKHYLSLASVGRKIYQNTVNDMIGKHRNSCHDREDMCPACRLFGMAKGDSFGSKVRITDAVAENKDTPKKEVVLKELGSPRTGYYPFYTSTGQEFDRPDVTIAGRKFYWHIPEVNEHPEIYTSEGNKKTIRNATMELISQGATFRFDVYYDGVTPEQLQELKWVLTLPDEDKSLMHKLGHGKPLGLGSIKISIDSEYRRSFDGEGYHVQGVEEESESSAEIPPRFDKDTVEQLQILMDYDAMKGKKVTYPYIEVPDDVRNLGRENDFASHKWFTLNKESIDKEDIDKEGMDKEGIDNTKYKTEKPLPMTLKKVTEERYPELKVYRASKKRG